MYKRVCTKLAQVLMLFGFEKLALRVILSTIEFHEVDSPIVELNTRPDYVQEPWVLKIVYEDPDVLVKGMLDMRDIKLARNLYEVN